MPFIPSWSKIQSIVGIADIRTLKNYCKYLEDAGLIASISKGSNKLDRIESQEKIFLNNPNLLYALSANIPNEGTVRETFFQSMLRQSHTVTFPKNGDFLIDNQYLFEIGGRKKDFSQLRGHSNAFIAADNIERGAGHKIPLWLFGFLY